MRECKDAALLRLKKVLLEDKLSLDTTVFEMLRADLTRVFNTYFEYNKKDLNIEIDVNAEGSFDIAVKLMAERTIPINSIK